MNSLRSPEDIWKEACVGREGYCSSDLQAAARDAILTAQVEALCHAAAIAQAVTLPPEYLWSESNFRKFQFGGEQACADIIAAAQGIDARSGTTGTGVIGEADESPVAESDAPTPSIGSTQGDRDG